MTVERIQDNLPEFVQKEYDWAAVAVKIEEEAKEFKEVPDISPRIYQLEPTNVCNVDCIMCPRKRMNRPAGYMKEELFQTIINRDLTFPQAVELFGFGESTLHPKLPEMIKALKDKGHYPVLATNATVLRPELSKRIVEAGLPFAVLDMDGDCKDTYEAVRLRGNYEKVESNIREFLKVKGDCFTVVQTIMLPQTKTMDEDAYREKWLALGADEVRIKFLDTFGGTVMVNEAREINNPDELNPRHACPELFYGVDVWQDGSVVPCGRYFDDAYVLGNLKDQSLAEIWKGEKAIALRKLHLEHRWEDLKGIGKGRCASCKEWGLTNLRFAPGISNNMFRGGFK